MRSFVCNVCGTSCQTEEERLTREGSACPTCHSPTRTRALVAQFSKELFGVAIPLPDFPRVKSLRGLGMSDPWPLADRLAPKFDYTNTYYHQSPKLDITAPDPADFGRYDFILSFEIMEHVPAPVEESFRNIAKLLKPNGILCMTVPHDVEGQTIEHFPQGQSTLTQLAGNPVLLTRRPGRPIEVFENLVFHGGPGSTLELRLFSAPDLTRMLLDAGFDSVQFITDGPEEFGAAQCEPWSLPIIARKGTMQVPVAEVAGEYAKAIQSARESAAQLEKIQQDYSRFVAFHNEHEAQRTKEVDGQLQWANKVDAQLEAANRWAMSLDEQLQRERAQRARYERSLWFRIARRLFL